MSSHPPRIAVVQFAPMLGEVEQNTKRARELCSRIPPGTVDLVCLPEMILTGYAFPDAEAITPFLEEPCTGPTSRFCGDIARNLRSYVTAGYPEKLSPEEIEVEKRNKYPKVGANSAVLYGPEGQWVGGYRKTNLYEIDKTWAKPGTGFRTFSLPPPLNTVTIAICMDLNPQTDCPWSLEGGPFEVADHCLLNTSDKRRTDLLILLNAWLDTRKELENEWDWWTAEYWMARLRPLWNKTSDAEVDSQDAEISSAGKATTVVICNRAGEENGTLYAGTSMLLKLRENSGEPEIVGVMKRRDEGVRIWTG